MMKHQKNPNIISYFARNLTTIIGIVLIWRGVWYLLDFIDRRFFGEFHIISAIGGIILGLLLLYLPDKSLKEIEKL